MHGIWEFPKIRGSSLDPEIAGLLLEGHPDMNPEFMETAT